MIKYAVNLIVIIELKSLCSYALFIEYVIIVKIYYVAFSVFRNTRFPDNTRFIFLKRSVNLKECKFAFKNARAKLKIGLDDFEKRFDEFEKMSRRISSFV